jgi:hypothetical protein
LPEDGHFVDRNVAINTAFKSKHRSQYDSKIHPTSRKVLGQGKLALKDNLALKKNRALTLSFDKTSLIDCRLIVAIFSCST